MGGYSTPCAMDRQIFATLKLNKKPLLCFNVTKFLISVPPPLVSRARGQKSSFFDLPQSNSKEPNNPPTISLHRHLSSARFDSDVGNVVTDAYLLHRCIATPGRGCRHQRVDFGRKQSTRAVTSRRLHSLPHRTNPHPTHVRSSNTTWPTSHASASLWGGVMPTNKRGYYHFYYYSYLLLFILPPRPPPRQAIVAASDHRRDGDNRGPLPHASAL